MVLALKRLRQARDDGFAEGLAAGGLERLAAGMERARQEAIGEGNFGRADALSYMQWRLALPVGNAVESMAAEIRDLWQRVRELENGAPSRHRNRRHNPRAIMPADTYRMGASAG